MLSPKATDPERGLLYGAKQSLGESRSRAVRRNLDELVASVKKNLPKVKGKVYAMGGKPDRAVVVSIAKYHKALNKLAQE